MILHFIEDVYVFFVSTTTREKHTSRVLKCCIVRGRQKKSPRNAQHSKPTFIGVNVETYAFKSILKVQAFDSQALKPI